MKIQKLFLPILILSLFFSGTLVQAQSKSEKEKEQKILELEQKLEQALQLQEAELEKALKESKKANNEELRKILENQYKVQQKAIEQYKKAWESREDQYHDLWSDKHEYFDTLSYDKAVRVPRYRVITPDVDYNFEINDKALKGLSGSFITTTRDRTALTIRKELEEVTLDTKFTYEVTEGSNGLNFKVSGEMDEGTLLIKLLKPNGKILQEIEISPLADVSWNQDLRWEKEEEQKENAGSWTIVVSANNASGQYSVNVRAN